MLSTKHVSLLFHRVDSVTTQTRVIDILCYVLVVLGLTGNLLGLFVFSSSRRTWQLSSTYVYLATASSITNVFCVIRHASILHSGLRNIFYEVVGEKWGACKLYEFSFCFRVLSSWITVFWMFERLICVSNKLRSLFNRCHSYKLNFIIPLIIIIIILVGVIGPPVYMFEPQVLDETLMDATMNINRTYCELNSNASMKWKQYFYEIHLGMNHFTFCCLFSELLPAGVIILFNTYIIYHVIRISRHLPPTNNHLSRTSQWMNLVLVLHSFLFLSSLLIHIIGHFTVVEAHEEWWVMLSVLINSSFNFYIYCLSGKAFRNEIRDSIRRFNYRFIYRRPTGQHQTQRCCLSRSLSEE